MLITKTEATAFGGVPQNAVTHTQPDLTLFADDDVKEDEDLIKEEEETLEGEETLDEEEKPENEEGDTM